MSHARSIVFLGASLGALLGASLGALMGCVEAPQTGIIDTAPDDRTTIPTNGVIFVETSAGLTLTASRTVGDDPEEPLAPMTTRCGTAEGAHCFTPIPVGPGPVDAEVTVVIETDAGPEAGGQRRTILRYTFGQSADTERPAPAVLSGSSPLFEVRAPDEDVGVLLVEDQNGGDILFGRTGPGRNETMRFEMDLKDHCVETLVLDFGGNLTFGELICLTSD